MSRAGLILMILASLAAGALADEPAEGGASAAAETPDAAALNPLATLDKSSLSGFRDMPLFTPSRRRPAPPPEPEAPEPEPEPVRQAPPPPPEPELKLSGVIEGPDGSVAIVQKEGAVERLRLGDQVDGWLVTGIEGYALKLTLNEREKEYRLFERSDAAATPDGAADSADGDDADATGDDAGGEPATPPPFANRPKRPPFVDRPEGE